MSLDNKNRRTMVVLASIATLMVGAAFAAVPLYEVFCQVTGYGGTTQRADVGSDRVIDREIRVLFNADQAGDLPWRFDPAQREMKVKVGQNSLAFYRAENRSTEAVTGVATYNVTPLSAGIYFSKVECFCFTEQVLEAGQEVDMPISFFIDPEIADDPNMDHVRTITLSYTFYRQDDVEDDAASADQPSFKTTENTNDVSN